MFVLLLLISDRQMSVFEFSFLGQFNIGLGLFQLLLLIGSIFLILLILVQRGKGGGLTGALGGMGGQSAFGAKAGDAFTKVTVVTSLIWITLCMVTIALFNQPPPKTQTTTKSLIDIARERESGISASSMEMDPNATSSVSIGAPDDTPVPPKEDGASAGSGAKAEAGGSDANADAGSDAKTDAGAGVKMDAGSGDKADAETGTSEVEAAKVIDVGEAMEINGATGVDKTIEVGEAVETGKTIEIGEAVETGEAIKIGDAVEAVETAGETIEIGGATVQE